MTLEEPGPVHCCALPNTSIKHNAFIFRILMTKSVPSFQISGRNIATLRCSNPKDLVPQYENMFAPNKIIQFCVTAVGAPRVLHDEGTEKSIFQMSLPKFCCFLQKQREVWLWLSLLYFYERDKNFVKETLSSANRIAYAHIHIHFYKATARCGSKFSTSLASC